jgi:hypothetical protein
LLSCLPCLPAPPHAHTHTHTCAHLRSPYHSHTSYRRYFEMLSANRAAAEQALELYSDCVRWLLLE